MTVPNSDACEVDERPLLRGAWEYSQRRDGPARPPSGMSMCLPKRLISAYRP